jgi:hypothetical protein
MSYDFVKGIFVIYKCKTCFQTEFAPLLIIRFTRKAGSIQEWPFLNPFWLSCKNVLLFCLNFPFIILRRGLHLIFTRYSQNAFITVRNMGLEMYESLSRSLRTYLLVLLVKKQHKELWRQNSLDWLTQKRDNCTKWQRAVTFAVLAPGGQSGNLWIHPRIKVNEMCLE